MPLKCLYIKHILRMQTLHFAWRPVAAQPKLIFYMILLFSAITNVFCFFLMNQITFLSFVEHSPYVLNSLQIGLSNSEIIHVT